MTASMLREVLRKLRADMMEAEAHVPWSAVRSSWRHRRAKWRQATKTAETVPDLAQRLQVWPSRCLPLRICTQLRTSASSLHPRRALSLPAMPHRSFEQRL